MKRIRQLVAVSVTLLTASAFAGEQVQVVFPGGDQLTGELVSESGDECVIQHAVLGHVTVPRNLIASKTGSETHDEAVDAGDARATAAGSEDVETAAIEPPSESPWKGSVSLAATGSKTTTSSYNIRLGAEAHRKSDSEQFDVTASWYWNQSNGATSDNDILVRADQEWFIADSRWLYFAQATWQYDQFEHWEHRVSPYGGVGYKLFDEKDLTLTLKGGGGVTWQYQDGQVDPQLLFELSTDWKIDDRQTLSGGMSIAPDPVDWGNYLAIVSVDWKMKLGSDTPWALNLGLRNIYDSQPSGGSTANDLKAYAGLSLDF